MHSSHTPSEKPPLGDPPVHLLTPFERRTFEAMFALYRRARPATETFLRSVGVGWINLGSKRMVILRGLERIAHLGPKDGILLVSNHRSFFDLYMLIVGLHNATTIRQPFVCPVRGDFFYQRPAGIAVNLFVAGGRMFPPFFREPEKAEFNKWGLRWVAEELQKGGLIVGFHPEGTRNKGPDPYTPLPAQPGVGRLVMETWPIVVPAFINGMSQDILADIKNNWVGERRCIAVFGEPIDLSPFKSMSNRLASHKRIADKLLESIFALSTEERALRAELGLS